MKNKNVQGIIALALVTALSFGVIIGSRNLAHNIGTGTEDTASSDVKVLEELDVSGAEGIEKAVKTEDGYTVTVKTKGCVADIVMNVSFDENVKNITKVEVTEQSETDGLGSLVAEDEFLSQFENVAAPVFLEGMSVDTSAAKEEKTEEKVPTDAVLTDGTYTAKTTEADQNGFTEEFTLTVKDGKVESAVWDCVDADGNKKSVLSENGEYVMTEDGPTWKEQSEALAAALVENQNVDFLAMTDEGKTDAVSGVSINVMGFASLAEDCLKQAAGVETAKTLNDGTYLAKTTEADQNGFTEEFTLTVKDGKVESAVWDCVDADGNKKSVLSENGEYVMTEDGPTWKEQSEALAAALVENQNVDFLAMTDEGKTDTVSGVSINVMGFAGLAEDCLKQAAGEQTGVKTEPEAALNDGTYLAKTTEADQSGFTEEFTLTVKDGKVESAVWDCVDADGNKKSVLSENGEYVMTEDGPTWKEQSEALAAALVENQNVDFLAMTDEGKTDAVSGVSINVMGFAGLAEDCLKQAAGEQAETEENAAETEENTAAQDGTKIDGISGATISSKAVVTGIDNAYNFLQTIK